MFVAGLKVYLKAMVHSGRPLMIAGLLDVVAPIGLEMPFDFDLQCSLFMNLVLTATRVSISAQTLMESGVLFNSRRGADD